MIIYKATNNINGKIYIGKTVKSLERRIVGHMSSKVGYFPNALRKYGISCFDFTIIETCESKEILREREIYWIEYFNSKWPSGYNLTDGGEGMSGHIPSKETRNKLSQALRGHKRSEEHQKNWAASRIGFVYSEKSREKMSESHKGIRQSDETRAKIRKFFKGVPLSESHRRKLSDAAKIRAQTYPMPLHTGKNKPATTER